MNLPFKMNTTLSSKYRACSITTSAKSKWLNYCAFCALFTVIIPFIGCNYSTQSIYPANIKTVYVKMFHNDTFYREVQYDLTRALCQRIEHQLPYKVVSDKGNADTILEGTIVKITPRGVSNERLLDRAIDREMVLTCQVTWKDLKSGKLYLDSHTIKVSRDHKKLLAQSQESALNNVANLAASQIVSSMEKPW